VLRRKVMGESDRTAVFSCSCSARDVDIVSPSLTVYDLLDPAFFTVVRTSNGYATEWLPVVGISTEKADLGLLLVFKG
jgi:hypothetical protein